MKKLSDYKGDESIELWMDLLDPITAIVTDPEIKKTLLEHGGRPNLSVVKTILKSHKSEATEILTRIDPEPIDGLNIVVRLIALLTEVGENDTVAHFFGYAEKVKTAKESFGSATENTEAKEN